MEQEFPKTIMKQQSGFVKQPNKGMLIPKMNLEYFMSGEMEWVKIISKQQSGIVKRLNKEIESLNLIWV